MSVLRVSRRICVYADLLSFRQWLGLGVARTALLTIVAAGVTFAAPTTSLAQQSRDVLLETIETSATDAPARAKRSQEIESDRLMANARRDLANGEIIDAVIQLQDLVRRYPGSTAAVEGRRVLGRLDQTLSAGRATAADGADSAASPGGQGRAQAQSGPALGDTLDPDSRKVRNSAWGGEYRRLQLDQEFREATGDRIFFGNASAELGARARQVLTSQTRWLRRHPDVGVIIEAHADDGSSTDDNLTIARQRGEAVRDHLISGGVAADRIRLSNRGRDLKVASCPQPACAAQNRRVITIVEGQVEASESTPRTGLAAPRRQ
jgi:outer membrane protein OmpA-like peptidoglycan-associated protein